MEKQILESIKSHMNKYGYAPSVKWVAKEFGLTRDGIMPILEAMQEKGLVRLKGPSKTRVILKGED